MNWQLDMTTRGPLQAERFVFLDTTSSDGETTTEPTSTLINAAHQAAAELVNALTTDGDEVSLSVNAHETTEGEGFRPAHISITVSRLDPNRDQASS